MANTKVTGDLIASSTIATGNIADNAVTSAKISGITTAHITEGSNLYYTDARARAAVSVSGNALSYNSSTGVITSNFEESPVFTGDVVIGTSTTTPSAHYNNLVIEDVAGNNVGISLISGTGNNTALYFGDSADTDVAQLKYSHATNTMFFVVNASEAMRIDSSGNVGIGTTSPTSLLHLRDPNTNSDVGIKIGNDSRDWNLKVMGSVSDSFQIFTHDNSNVMTITSGGNVGIGVTPSYTGVKLHTYNNSTDAYNIFESSANKWVFGEAGGVCQVAGRYGHHSGINVDTGGNVGIGTTSPESGAKLDVRAGSGGKIVLGSYDANYKVVVEGGDQLNFYNGASGTTAYMNYAGPGNILLSRNLFVEANSSGGTSGTVRIKSDGKVGIGTTSPSTKLHVVTSSQSIAKFESSNSDGPYTEYYQGTTPLGFIGNAQGLANAGIANMCIRGQSQLIFSISSVEKMRIHSSGNVAIGTTTPVNTYSGLTVSGSDPSIALKTTSGSGWVWQQYVNSSGTNNFSAGVNQSVPYYGIKAGAGLDSPHFAIASSGNVGINTITPNRKLHVGGKAIIGQTNNYSSNSGTLHVYGSGSENSGVLDIQNNGNYRYYTRVCHNANTSGNAGYWHIKTNISSTANIMFLAKFYGYIYGSAQVLDLQHSGYAYSATGTVINQGTTNNGSDANASSAIYISANGSKVTFRIAFGSGSNFSTYYCGVFMDIAFPNPAGAAHDFEIEAQSFSTSTTVY